MKPRLLTQASVTEAVTDIETDSLGRLLAASPLAPTASEAHGMLCGLICGGGRDPLQTWLVQLLPLADPSLDAAREDLRPFALATSASLHDPELGFTLLLPDDGCPLVQRATGLYDWVRGFLFAIGVLGITERDLSEQTREILHDFNDLTRIDLDDLDDPEEHEEALAELTEFIRVSALLIHDERAHLDMPVFYDGG